MKKLSAYFLVTWFAILISTSSCYGEKENKQSRGEQQQTASKTRLSLNLKKGFSCQVVYSANINISQEGQSDDKGEWKVKAEFILKCEDVDDNGIMTISQSPLKISIEGIDIKGKHEIDFHSPDKNQQIPHLIRGHLHPLIAIKSARLDTSGRVIAARQSPDVNDFDFMAMGKISYQDDQKWILSDSSEEAEKQAEYIVSSVVGITPTAMGKEFTIEETTTMAQESKEKDAGQSTYDWTLKRVDNRTAQFEVKGSSFSESRNPENLVDEVEQFHSSSEGLMEFDIDTGLTLKSTSNVEHEHKTMTYIPLISERVPTFSNSSKMNYIIEIIK